MLQGLTAPSFLITPYSCQPILPCLWLLIIPEISKMARRKQISHATTFGHLPLQPNDMASRLAHLSFLPAKKPTAQLLLTSFFQLVRTAAHPCSCLSLSERWDGSHAAPLSLISYTQRVSNPSCSPPSSTAAANHPCLLTKNPTVSCLLRRPRRRRRHGHPRAHLSRETEPPRPPLRPRQPPGAVRVKVHTRPSTSASSTTRPPSSSTPATSPSRHRPSQGEHHTLSSPLHASTSLHQRM
jgi:hypothetical protein